MAPCTSSLPPLPSRTMDVETALVENAFLYVTTKKCPADCMKNKKRCIRRRAERLVKKQGVIFYRKKDGNEVQLCWSPWRTLPTLIFEIYCSCQLPA